MGAHKLTRWQKASALVPMAVLVGAWGAALTNTGLANASNGVNGVGIPDVPSTAFEQPASVQPGLGIDNKAGADGTVATLSANGIPAAALAAYRRAETLLGKADSSCKLPWNLIAAIGRVESNHGRSNGNTVKSDGVSSPGIYGVPLTGANGTAKISDSDNGDLDHDAVYDRAVGPMQFLPGTWKSVAVDADGDGKKNPQDIDDAAAASGVYLCAGEGDLSTRSGAAAAVLRYNHSSSYVDLVLRISEAYAQGDFTQSPNGYGSSSILTSSTNDQTLSPNERSKAGRAQQKAGSDATPGSGSSTAPGSSNTGSEDGSSTPGDDTSTPPASGGDPTSSAPKTTSGQIGAELDDTPLAPITGPVTDLLSKTEATTRCTFETALLPLSTHTARFNACVYDYTH